MESKATFTNRLRAEGRWDEASIFMDQERRRLREAGQTRSEAKDNAWAAAQEKYPRLPPATVAEQSAAVPAADASKPAKSDAPPPVDTSDLFPLDGESGPLDLLRDISWCYANLDRLRVTPADAPTPGSWGLLAYARENRARFFDAMLPRIMPKSTADGQCLECEKRRIADQKAEENCMTLVELCNVLDGCASHVCPNCKVRFMFNDALDEPPYDPETVFRPDEGAKSPNS